jgi:hypothetical protein
VLPGPEIQMWIVDGFAQGAAPWFIKFNGKVPDTRWTRPVIEAFDLHARVEPLLSTLGIVADIALLSQFLRPRICPGRRIRSFMSRGSIRPSWRREYHSKSFRARPSLHLAGLASPWVYDHSARSMN